MPSREVLDAFFSESVCPHAPSPGREALYKDPVSAIIVAFLDFCLYGLIPNDAWPVLPAHRYRDIMKRNGKRQLLQEALFRTTQAFFPAKMEMFLR